MGFATLPRLTSSWAFAIMPLVTLTRDKAKMGALVAPGWLTPVAGVVAAIIIALNMKLLWDIAGG